MFYEEVFKLLNYNEVKYVVVGGVALVLHGVIRMTADLDLLIGMDQSNVIQFLTAIEELGYQPKVPVTVDDFKDPAIRRRWKEEEGMEIFSFFHPDKPLRLVDVFLEEPIDFVEIDAEKKSNGKRIGCSCDFYTSSKAIEKKIREATGSGGYRSYGAVGEGRERGWRMKSSNEQIREFSFHLSRDKIEAFRKCSAEEKLNWLEDVNKFVDTFVPEENRQLWARLCSSKREEGMG